MVQYGRTKGCMLISNCKSTKITTSCWTAIDRRTLEPTKQRYHTSKDKETAMRQKSLQGCNHDKIKSHTHWMVTHKLENNTNEVLPLLWRFWAPHQASQPEHPEKGLGIPRKSDPEGQQDLISGLPQAWEKHRLYSSRAQTKACVHQDPAERSSAPTWHWTRPIS